MYLQALLIRAAVAAATGLMLTAAIFIGHGGQAAHATTPTTKATSARSAMPEPVTLPTIHVHPTAAELASASMPKQTPARLVFETALPELSASSAPISLRGSSIDMPYYSFGKVLPRIGKE